jgi:SAM-dependent methyltransferase
VDDILAKALPEKGVVLELGSGTGERVLEFARDFPHLEWQPSDRDPLKVAAAIKRREAAALPNLLRPIELDVLLQPWSIAQVDAIVAIEYAHLVPWDLVAGAFGGGARLLQPGGLFYLFGPFKFHGKYGSTEHQDLDQTLRARDPALGLRDIRELTVAGTRTGLGLEHAKGTARGHALVFRRRALLPPTGQFKVS